MGFNRKGKWRVSCDRSHVGIDHMLGYSVLTTRSWAAAHLKGQPQTPFQRWQSLYVV